MMIRQIIKEKYRMQLKAAKVGDFISYLLANLNIISLLSVEEGFEIKEKESVLFAWRYIFGGGIRQLLNKTFQDLSKKEFQVEKFNKQFKINCAEDHFYQNYKNVLLKFIKKYEEKIYLYLNKELPEEVGEAPQNIKGDIAYLE